MPYTSFPDEDSLDRLLLNRHSWGVWLHRVQGLWIPPITGGEIRILSSGEYMAVRLDEERLWIPACNEIGTDDSDTVSSRWLSLDADSCIVINGERAATSSPTQPFYTRLINMLIWGGGIK